MAQAVQDLAGKPADAEAFSKQPQLQVLIEFMNTSAEPALLEGSFRSYVNIDKRVPPETLNSKAAMLGAKSCNDSNLLVP